MLRYRTILLKCVYANISLFSEYTTKPLRTKVVAKFCVKFMTFMKTLPSFVIIFVFGHFMLTLIVYAMFLVF